MTEPTTFELAGRRGSVAVHEWGAGAPRYVVLLAHGYGEHARRYDHLAHALVADGAVVYAPDHLGHGRSEGERALVEDGEDMVADLALVGERAASKHPGVPVVLIGHSMGGLIATRYAQQHGGGLAALVLSGPVIGGNPEIEALLDMDPMPDVPIDPAILSRDPAVGEAYMADELIWHGPFKRQTLESLFKAVAAVAEDGPLSVPTLWIHGEEDELAPLEHTRPAAERIAGETFEQKVYPGARHEIFNETNRDEVIGDVVEFIAANLPRT
jgi:alpha-beta hydrolase superfamily lysophospholipase